MKRQTLVVPARYPVRFWLLILTSIELPNFVHFDSSGKTHDVSLFNPTSLSVIGLTLLTCALLLVMPLLNRQKLSQRVIRWEAWAWFLLLANYLLSTLLSPPAHLTPSKVTDLPVAMFRIFEWVVLFALLISVYTREPVENASRLMTRVIGYACWTQLSVVWILFLFLPTRVYAVSDDLGSSHARFGGGVANPVYLAVMASIGFYYALFFWRGKLRYFGCALSFVTLMLTYARSAQLLFFIALFAYLLIFSKSLVHRALGALWIAATLGLVIAFAPTILDYLERGHGLRNVVTLSERTDVWEASLTAFTYHPWLGYGFVIGVKNAIKDHWNATNWVPPYAHNEYIQALVSGGIVAAALDVYLHLRVLWTALRDSGKDVQHVFFLVAYIQIFGMSFLTATVSYARSEVGAMFLLLFFAIVVRTPKDRSAAATAPRAFSASPAVPEMALSMNRWRSPPLSGG